MRLAALGAALLLAGCAVAPPVQPYLEAGRPLLDQLAEQADSNPKAAIKAYLRYLQDEADFDKDYDFYQKQFAEDIKAIGANQGLKESPVNGHFYVYNEHVAALAQAHFGLARAYLLAGDYVRAERAAMLGGKLADLRAWERLVGMEAQAQQWDLLTEIYKKAGLAGPLLVAGHERDFYRDQLKRTDPPQAQKKYVEEARKLAKDLVKEEIFIETANSKRRTQVAGLTQAGLSAGLMAVQTYSDTHFQQNDASRAYSQSNMVSLQNMFSLGMANAGEFGKYAAFAFAFSGPSMIEALSNPKAGVDPMGLVKEFSQRAQSAGLSDNVLVQLADATSKGAQVLDSARKGGDARGIQNAVKSFLPSYEKLSARLQKGKDEALRKQGEAGEGGEDE